MNMDKYFMWIHYERLQNHNKAKHNKTVCIFLGIYCMELKVSDNVNITLEPCVKAYGVNIDNRLTFTDHVSSCDTKATRQQNALSRISQNFDLKCWKLIFQSFILRISRTVD